MDEVLEKATSTITLDSKYSRNSRPSVPVTLDDFQYIRTLGSGSYSEVFLVKKYNSDTEFAMKVLYKQFLLREKKFHQVYVEKEVLSKFRHPFILRLRYSFQDNEKFYLVTDYCQNGSLAELLKENSYFTKTLSLELIKFYMAEIVCAVKYLHLKGLAHRDLKPDNIMINKNFHITLIDFGTARFFDISKVTPSMRENLQRLISEVKRKTIGSEDDSIMRKATFVGTSQYVSPELLENDECSNASDLWAIGCILYEMLFGSTPFVAENEYQTFENIRVGSFDFPVTIPVSAGDLISKLLVREPKERIGSEIESIELLRKVKKMDTNLWKIMNSLME